MNKIFRFCVPLLVAFLALGMLVWLAGASSQVVADPLPSSPQGAILVDTLDDELNSDGDCSLREAIEAAETNAAVDACPAGDAVITDTITFDVAGTITVTSRLSVTAGGPLVIDGGDVITISGGESVRIFYVNVGAHRSLERLALVDGCAWDGGGIWNDGTLTITNSTLSGNSAAWGGGGILNFGTLTITNSTLTALPAGACSVQGYSRARC